MYNYRDSKANIINILNSKTPIEKSNTIPNDDAFTFENGIKTKVASIFIDIKDSTTLFNAKDEKLARLMRAFTSEAICIMQDFNKYNEIGIRGDCVYAIYDIDVIEQLEDVFVVALTLNTFMNMFNKIIKSYGYKSIIAGIGIGYDEDLIIKAGRSGTGINDKIWIGKAVVDASNLSSEANRGVARAICMSKIFFENAYKYILKRDSRYKIWIKPYYVLVPNTRNYRIAFYNCDVTLSNFSNWIKGGMR